MNERSNKALHVRAPLKWSGGKYKLLDRVYKALKPGKRLIEPFALNRINIIYVQLISDITCCFKMLNKLMHNNYSLQKL